MSGRQKRAARKAAEARANVHQEAGKSGSNSGFLNGLLRLKKRTLAYCVIGAMAAAWTAEQILFWAGLKPEYSLRIVFLSHGSTEDAERYVAEIDSAAKQGTPFQLGLHENAGLSDAALRKFVEVSNENLEKAHTAYGSMLNAGYTTEAARQALIDRHIFYDKNSGTNSSFLNIISAGMAMEGMFSMPLESHPVDETERDIAAENKSEQFATNFQALAAAHAPLGEIMLLEREKSTLYERFDERNKVIAANLRSKLDLSLRFSPKLFLRRWLEGRTIDAIAFMGGEHINLERDLDTPEMKRHVRLSFEKYDSETTRIHDAIVRGMARPRVLTEVEGYRIALEMVGLGSVNKDLLDNNMPEVAERLTRNTLAMPLEKFRELDENSLKIPDLRDRFTYILNEVYGERMFGVNINVR